MGQRNMRQKRTRKKKKNYGFQIMLFVLGIVCVVPALSFADDLDDVIDDLISHRIQVRRDKGQNEMNVGRVASDIVQTASNQPAKKTSSSAQGSHRKDVKPSNNSVAKATK